MSKNKKCQFRFKTAVDDLTCSKPPLQGSNYCIFHKPNKTEQETKLFTDEIKKKLQKKDYDFTGYCFPGRVSFKGQVFKKLTQFNASTFEGGANFAGVIFQEYVSFWKSTFRGSADFHNSTFRDETHFDTVTFEGNANFEGTTFGWWAEFTELTVKGGAYFQGSNFEGLVDFLGSTFEESASFHNSTFGNIPGFDHLTFKNNIWAVDVYRIAKSSCQKLGEYTLAGEYYYKERIAKRKLLPWYSLKRWFEYILLDGLCGYGERPLRAIRTGLGVLFGLALLYWRIGHIYPSPELFKEPDHALTFLDALYFSVVTFTTLGFGDWRPDPSHWIRYVVMLEAFFGAFLMALFIVTFARRMMR